MPAMGCRPSSPFSWLFAAAFHRAQLDFSPTREAAPAGTVAAYRLLSRTAAALAASSSLFIAALSLSLSRSYLSLSLLSLYFFLLASSLNLLAPCFPHQHSKQGLLSPSYLVGFSNFFTAIEVFWQLACLHCGRLHSAAISSQNWPR